jgi:hypothetical protein
MTVFKNIGNRTFSDLRLGRLFSHTNPSALFR